MNCNTHTIASHVCSFCITLDCGEFVLTGQLYARCEGGYIRTNMTCAGQPVYQKVPGSNMRYYIFNQHSQRWHCTSRSSCSAGMFLESPKSITLPKGQWFKDSEIFLHCIPGNSLFYVWVTDFLRGLYGRLKPCLLGCVTDKHPSKARVFIVVTHTSRQGFNLP